MDTEIATFVQPVIKGGLLSARGNIKRIDIIALKDMKSKSVEFHALVTIEPEKSALKAIKILNGQPFKGQSVTVQKYCIRNRGNDTRSPKNNSMEQSLKKRTNRQRRRKLEIVDRHLC